MINAMQTFLAVKQAEVDDLKFQVEQLKKTIVEKDMRINKTTYVLGEVIGLLKCPLYTKDDVELAIEKLKSL